MRGVRQQASQEIAFCSVLALRDFQEQGRRSWRYGVLRYIPCPGRLRRTGKLLWEAADITPVLCFFPCTT